MTRIALARSNPLEWSPGQRARRFVPLLLGLSPLALIGLSWVPEGVQMSPGIAAIKAWALPVLVVELATIFLGWTTLHEPAEAGRGLTRLRVPVMLLFILMFATALFVAVEPGPAIIRSGIWVIHGLFAMAMFRLVRANAFRSGDLVEWLIFGFILAALIILAFSLGVEDPASFNWGNYLPGFDNIRRAGYFAAPIAALCIGLMVGPEKRSKSPLAVAGLSLAFTIIIWSGSRGALLATFTTFVCAFLLFPAVRRISVVAHFLIAFGLGMAIAQPFPRVSSTMGIERMLSSGTDSSGRTLLWQETVQAISDRPLLGHGEEQINALSPFAKKVRVLHPHNLLLQLLLAWGVVGLALVAAIAAPLAREVWVRSRQQGGEFLSLALAMVSLVLFSAIDGTLFHVHSTAIFFACLGAFLGAARQGISPISSGAPDRQSETGEEPRQFPPQ